MIEKNAGIPMGQPQTYTDLSSLQKIAVQGRTDKAAAMQSIAKQFESMMVQQMMKSMRQANEAFADGDMTSSSEEKFYQDMFDSQLSLSLSQGRGFGLAEAMLRQFRGKYASATTAAAGVPIADEHDLRGSSLQSTSRQALTALSNRNDIDSNGAFTEELYQLFQGDGAGSGKREVSATDAGALDGTPENFIRTLRPAAERIAQKLGVDSRLLLSQAALETGWGQKVLQRSNGASSFNFFNIKAGSDWQGATVTVPTIEYQDGVAVRETATFRAYRSPEESFNDYANLIADNPRYQQALQHGKNSGAYINALASAGYATDPRYAQKVLALFNGEKLNGEKLNGEKLNAENLANEQWNNASAQSTYSDFDTL